MSVNEVKRAPPPPPLQILGASTSNTPSLSRTYNIGSEDHTLGNALRHILLVGLSGRINFCGYSVPHPSEEVVALRVQIKKPKKGEGEAQEGDVNGVVKEGCRTLMGVCDHLRDEILRKTEVKAREE
jgi:DNA-directed RNA polymerase I and III subunit RPAC2